MTHDINQILAERQHTHGDYSEHARITQNIKAMMHDSPNWTQLSVHQIETLEMIAHKIGRILAGNPHFADHFLDIAGYAKLSADRLAVPVAAPAPEPAVAQADIKPRTLTKLLRGDHDINRVLADIDREAKGE